MHHRKGSGDFFLHFGQSTYLKDNEPLRNQSLGHPGGWAMLWSADELLNGQRKRVDNTAHVTTAHDGLSQKRLEDDLY